MGIITALGLSLLLSPVPSDTVFVLPARLAASPPEIDERTPQEPDGNTCMWPSTIIRE